MTDLSPYPGTPQHQALLRAVVSYYQADPRVLAVVLFGSLGRDAGDALSDLDLDIILADGVQVDAMRELARLCDSFGAIGERAALIVPDGDDAGDVVLESLRQLSVRYHPLADTSPNIVPDMRVLCGRLDAATIAAAGLANSPREERQPDELLCEAVRYALEACVYLQRGQLWLAVEVLHRARNALIELHGRTRSAPRVVKAFQAQADADLQARLAATLPQYDPASLRAAVAALVGILEADVDRLANGRVALTEPQRGVLAAIRRRLAECGAPGP